MGTRARSVRAAVLALVAAAGATSPAPPAPALPLPQAPGCAIFPEDNPWNRRVDDLPVADDSEAILRSIGLDENLHADFGSGRWDGGPIGIPITVVPRDQRRVGVSFRYADESDPGPYPIPDDVKIEGGRNATGDRHALILRRGACKLYELFALRRDDGRWRAGSGAIWDLSSNDLRPEGWTSADAAGLPILPGLARWDEVRRGRIDHALRFTVESTRAAYVYPATHFASDSDDPALPPMGLRVRLEESFPIRDFPPQARIVLRALKRYGMMLADNGSDLFISGAPNRNWNNDALHTLHDVVARHLEVVDASSFEP